MEGLSAILCANVLPGLGERVAAPGGFKKWLISGSYSPEPCEGGGIQLTRVSIPQFSHAMSFDYERFALSSLESYCVALSERREYGSASWPLLKLYYSSFFAAHAVLRSRGAGIINLDMDQASSVVSILNIYGHDNFDFSAGMYLLSTNTANGGGLGEISVHLAPVLRRKGVHGSFWILFSEYLMQQAQLAIENGSPDSREFFEYSCALQGAITGDERSSSWLSEIRNKINYEHDYESWMPFRKGSEANILSSLLGSLPPYSASLTVPRKKYPLEAFMNTSCYISNLNLMVGNYVAERSKIGGGFGQKWRRLKCILKVA